MAGKARLSRFTDPAADLERRYDRAIPADAYAAVRAGGWRRLRAAEAEIQAEFYERLLRRAVSRPLDAAYYRRELRRWRALARRVR